MLRRVGARRALGLATALLVGASALASCGAECLRDTDCDGPLVCSAGLCEIPPRASAQGDAGVAPVASETPGSGGSATAPVGTTSTPPRGNLDAGTAGDAG